MANYKVVDTEKLDADLTVVADAIREKGSTSEPLAFPNGMADAVRGIQSGGGTNWFEYANTLYSLFQNAIFEEGAEIELSVGTKQNSNLVYNAFLGTFLSAFGMKSVKIKCKEQTIAISANRMFSCNGGTCVLESVDFSDAPVKFYDMQQTFAWRNKLREILGELDVSENTTFSSCFLVCTSLEYIRFKEKSIEVNINFGVCSKLSAESIQSIIDGLATVETSQTLTFHADVKSKLTETQIATITSKNWTLA